jgi:hypothetical protein
LGSVFLYGKVNKMSRESFHIEEPQEDEVVSVEQAEQDVNKEKERGFDLDFYITDHSADKRFDKSPDELRELYADIAKDGIGSVRYDWDWRYVEPKADQYDQSQIEHYAEAKKMMHEAGLKEPTIILSNPPEWAKELYKQDPEKFFEGYADYVAEVAKGLEAAGGEKVTTVQILNELNNSFYTPIKVEDLPRLCQITRDAFKDYNPDIKLMASLLAANSPDMVKWGTLGRVSLGTPIEKYLPKLKKIKDSFDVIAVDYYPGMWHFAPGDFDSFKAGDIYQRMVALEKAEKAKRCEAGEEVKEGKEDEPGYGENLYKAMVKNVDLLKAVFQEIATWDKEYELGEVGMRTNESRIAPIDEKGQRYFYDVFFRAFKKMMLELQEEDLPLPSRVGFYESVDEPPKDRKGKIMRKAIPFPEHDMGMRTADGERKMILRGSPNASKEQGAQQPSQLRKIISYLRAPVENK